MCEIADLNGFLRYHFHFPRSWSISAIIFAAMAQPIHATYDQQCLAVHITTYYVLTSGL